MRDVNYRRTRKEIVDKMEEIYILMKENKMEIVKGILYTDALSWVLGDDYLNFEQTGGDKYD